MNRAVNVALVAVALHLLAHAAHGVAHELIPVHISAWQTAYVVVVVFVLPLVGAGLLLRDRPRVGASLLVVAGVAALAFEVASHFVLDNPDHVGSVDAGSGAFAATAVLAALSAVLPIAAGAWVLVASRRRSVDDLSARGASERP